MDVGVWLKELGLDHYAEAFDKNGVDGALLREITNEDLKDLGIARIADRKKLLKAIAEISGGNRLAEAGPLPPAKAEGERRPVIVLFADLTGYTRLSGELDFGGTPRTTRRILRDGRWHHLQPRRCDRQTYR